MNSAASFSSVKTDSNSINSILAERQRLRDKALLEIDDSDKEFDPKLMLAGIVTWIDDKCRDAHIGNCDGMDQRNVVVQSLGQTTSSETYESLQSTYYISTQESQSEVQEGRNLSCVKERSGKVGTLSGMVPLYLADQISKVQQLVEDGQVSMSILKKMKKIASHGPVGNTITSSADLYVVHLVVRERHQYLDKSDGTLAMGIGHSEDEALINAIGVLQKSQKNLLFIL